MATVTNSKQASLRSPTFLEAQAGSRERTEPSISRFKIKACAWTDSVKRAGFVASSPARDLARER
eukprot:6592148-Heterocapsa_arctica.AAC.1